jgi:energy-coupling factor transporter ATP-binding protein EcfA2
VPPPDAPGGSGAACSARRRLVVVSGPIASGKSTLAAELARLLRSAGESVAVVGLDTVAEMALPTLDDWAWAREIYGQVVRAWLKTPISTVIAEGTAIPSEVGELLGHVPRDVRVVTVLLVTRYETALSRVRADPTRGRSRDPEFLDRMYRRFNDGLTGMAADLSFTSDESSAGALAAKVAAALDAGSP